MKLARLALLCAACGGSAATTVSVAPTPSASAGAPDDGSAQREDAARERARQLAGGALELRRRKLGECPTLDDVLAQYAYPPGTELDSSGARFTISCTERQILIVDHRNVSLHTQLYYLPTPDRPSEELPPTATPVSAIEEAMARFRPWMRACYNKGLQNDPSLAGVVHGTIVVAPDGTVRDVVFDRKTTTLPSEDVLACIRIKMMNTGSFPPQPGANRRITF